MSLVSEDFVPPTKKLKVASSSCDRTTAIVNTPSKMSSAATSTTANGHANGAAAAEGGGEQLDSNLYSRQIYALGESAMLKLRKSAVLISGMGAVGVEVAKNLVLGGVRRVTIHDTATATWSDLAAQYYLHEADIGKNRAQRCFSRLEELNDSVQCSLLTEELSEDVVAQFDVTILTEAPHSRQLIVNGWTRQHGRHFIAADARGLFSYAFVDLGAQFVIQDANGDACKEAMIEYVDRETGNVHTLEGALHGLEDGDHVTFSEVRGMTQLNDCTPLKATVLKPNIFNIGNVPAGYGDYVEGGRMRQVKQPQTVEYKTLKEQLTDPECVIWDFAHFEAPRYLHALWQALYAFEQNHSRRPEVRSEEDAQLLKAELAAFVKEEVPEEWLRNFAFSARGNLQPVASLIGGISAQEAMKAITHHTTPQKQFLYTHHLEALSGDYSPYDAAKLTAADCMPRNSRYDAQAAVFGWRFQEALHAQRWFIVGSGAIGCELLKNLAMMGVGCGTDANAGHLKITDMDQIELSNLNRQFLFRRVDVGQKKSEVAARSVRGFNSHINVVALTDRVAEDTEHVFSDDFFSGLTGVVNALDNVEARRYMDHRCVYYELPLLESGTMGSKASTQVVYPHLTESYSSTNDPPEKDTPICTLKHFPYEIHHTIQWGRGQFEDLFTTPAEKVNQYVSNTRGFLDRLSQQNEGQQIQDLKTLKQALIDEKPSSADDCIKWARDVFQQNYFNDIAQLLHNFPSDQLTSSGVRFWSGTKRCPHVLKFDAAEPFHLDFLFAASILRAEQYGIAPITDRDMVTRIASKYRPAEFAPRSGVHIAVTEGDLANEGEQSGGDADSVIDTLKLSLARLQLNAGQQLRMIDFEKDDDTNHHVQFVTAASNLRAANYDIAQADAMKTKQIAGRIIPALATTTAVVAGLVSLELYKTAGENGRACRGVPLERFKNGFLNLAGPFYTFSEPGRAPLKRYNNKDFTLWDRLEVRGPKTLRELIDWISHSTNLEVTMLSSGVSLLYAFFQPAVKVKERMERDVLQVVADVTRAPLPPHRRTVVFDAVTSDKEGEDVDIPFIKFYV